MLTGLKTAQTGLITGLNSLGTAALPRGNVSVSLLTGSESTTDATSYVTASVSPAANSLVIVTVGCFVNSVSGQTETPTLSGLGATWTLLQDESFALSRHRLTTYYAQQASYTTGTVTISFGSETQEACTWYVTQATGHDTAAPVVQSAGTQSTTTPITNTLAAFEHPNNVNMSFYTCRGTLTYTEDADFTTFAQTSPDTIQSGGGYAVNQTECTVNNGQGFGDAMISVEVKAGTA